MSDISLPPKVKELIESPCSEIVDKMLDAEISYKKIQEYLKGEGITISLPYLGTYKKYRNSINVEEQNVEKFIGKTTVAKVVLDNKNKKPLTAKEKLKSDLEFIDLVIQTGAEILRKQIKDKEAEVTIGDVFEAIKLKDKLTDGAMAGLTEYGIEHLQNMTEEKYMKLIKVLYNKLPEADKKIALEEMEKAEHDFFKNTDYYEEYLRGQGLSEKEIRDKLNEKSN